MLTTTSMSLWETVQEGEDMSACKAIIRSGGLSGPDGATLQFKWHPTQPGDGRRRANSLCTSHVDCLVICRAAAIGGKFFVQVSAHEHSDVPVDRGRLSFALSTGQRDLVRTLVNTGTRPAAIVASLTLQEVEKCKDAGIQPEKRAEGGLVGKVPIWHRHMAVYCATPAEYT